MLEENDGAGNTFKATAKPVLIGTAVVGSTTMIFSIIMSLTEGLTTGMENLSLLYPPFLLGLITGGAIIYWFTGASIQAVTTGAYRAVEFIKGTIKLDGVTKASEADSRRVVEICTQYAQQGMINMFLGVFFATLAFAFVEPYLFIGYLISIAVVRPLPGDLHGQRRRRLGQREEDRRDRPARQGHRAARRHDRRRHRGRPVQGHLVGGAEPGHQVHDAVRPAGRRAGGQPRRTRATSVLVKVLAAAFFAVSVFFVHRSFYGMRIEVPLVDDEEYPEEPDGSGGFGGSGALPEGSSALAYEGAGGVK